MIDELMKNKTSQPSTEFPLEVCYYFFSKSFSTRNSPADAYRAIATQILEHFYGLEKINNLFSLWVGNGATINRASESEIVDTISQCLPHLPNLYFVIDAIDESSEDHRLIQQLSKWCEGSPLKVLLFSRPDVASLRRRIPETNRIILSEANVNADIACYLNIEINNLIQDNLLPCDVDQSNILSHLVHRAEGMFLWARLIIAYLNGPAMTQYQRLKTIMEVNTEGLDQLDEMYKCIEARINSMDPYSKQLARQSLMWVSYSMLTPGELKEALFAEGWDMEPRDMSEQFEHAVIIVCGGLVEKHIKAGGCFRYIHLTALEFVQRGSRSPRHIGHPLIPSESISKALIATRCISSLETIPQRPLSARLGQPALLPTVKKQWPLLRFALGWMELSLQAIASSLSTDTPAQEVLDMVDRASEYLRNGLSIMVWVEAWYSFHTATNVPIPEHTTSNTRTIEVANFAVLQNTIGDLSRAMSLEVIQNANKFHFYLSEAQEFVQDMILLQTEWGKVLSSSPHEIWGDVTIFTKSRFFVSTKAASAECLAPEMMVGTYHDPRKTTKPTFSISMSSVDGRQLAVLAIFSPEYVLILTRLICFHGRTMC